MRDPRPFWWDHLGRTSVAWCDPKYMVWKTPESHGGLDNDCTTVWSEGKVWEMVWTMVALRSDQKAKSGKWSGQWSRYGLIRRQSLGNGLDNGRATVWSEGKVWEMVWTMVALRSDQRAKSHYSLILNYYDSQVRDSGCGTSLGQPWQDWIRSWSRKTPSSCIQPWCKACMSGTRSTPHSSPDKTAETVCRKNLKSP